MDPFPRLIFIADRFTESRTYERTVAAAEEGLPWVHLRDHRADPELFRDAAEGLIGQIWSANPATLITVNANLEVAAAFETGFHTGRRGPDVEEARHRLGPEALIGYSAHSIEAGTAAERAGADYLFFSPIYAADSKPRKIGVGIEALERFCRFFGEGIPTFALGGVTTERVAECRNAGAYGVAVLSGILEADDVEHAVDAYMQAL